jgi:hypothetical protein
MRLFKKKSAQQSQKEYLYNPDPMPWQPNFSTWSPEKKKEEYQKCKQNPIYWAKTYGVIQHPHKGKLPFKLFPFQEIILKSFFKVDNLVVNKSRQMGISTLIAGFSFWLACFYNDKNILIIATKGEVAKNIIKKVKIFYQFAPKWLKPQIVSWNVFSITFSNGSMIKASTTTIDAARSEALSLLIIDEAAHISKLNEIWTAAFPTLSTGGKAIMLSSPNGASGFFYELCRDASKQVELPEDPKSTDTTLRFKTLGEEKGEAQTNFTLITLPWQYHPERDEIWYKKTCEQAKYDWRKISQEYLCSFEGSGKKVVEPKILVQLKEHFIKSEILDTKEDILNNILSMYSEALKEYLKIDGDTLEGEKERLKVLMKESVKFFELPSVKTMVAGIDVASGGGSDFSTVVLGDLQKSVACTVQIKTDTKTFSIILFLLASYYNHAHLFIESNSYGNDVLIRLTDDYYYENVKKDDKGNFGFFTHRNNRHLLISDFIASMNYPDITQKPKFHDSRIYSELENFVWKNGKAQADSDCNDDFIIAFALYIFGVKSFGDEPGDMVLVPIRGDSTFNAGEEANKHAIVNWQEVVDKHNLLNVNIKDLKDDFDTEYLAFVNAMPDAAREQMEQYREMGIAVKSIEEVVLEKLLRKKNIIK